MGMTRLLPARTKLVKGRISMFSEFQQRRIVFSSFVCPVLGLPSMGRSLGQNISQLEAGG